VKIAIIGDIHANLPALEAVLSHAKKQEVDEIWNVGDFVGYGAFPEEVVKRMRKEKILSIIGNYDDKVLQVKKKQEEWGKGKHPLKWFAFKWAYDQLSKESRDYLRGLPVERRIEVKGKKFLLVHGSPASIKEHITTDTPDRRLRDLHKTARADVIICGHSHRPFAREVEGAFFINPGSVGRSDDGDARASYAVLDIRQNSFQFQHFRIEYDIKKAVDGLKLHKLPEEFSRMVVQGRSLDAVMGSSKAGGKKASRERQAKLRDVLRLAKKCSYEVDHTLHVTMLTLNLFDELKPLHGLGAEERFLLECACLLHDIGWVRGRTKHHKTSFRMIMKEKLPFTDKEKLIISLIARYHRKNIPDRRQKHFSSLDQNEQKILKSLASILRVSDGLDRSHQSIVQALRARVTPKEIAIECDVGAPAEWEIGAGLKKGDLMERHFKRKLAITPKQI